MTNVLQLILDDWNDDVIEIRRPIWLTKTERNVLAEAIVDLIAATTVFPTTRDHLDAVLTELGVAEARDQIWPAKTEIVRLTYGYNPDALPIRMSDSELQAVQAIPGLPPSLTQRLADAADKK